jgi:autoinducer 2-degrading protein
MHTVLVNIHVLEEKIIPFIEATLDNVHNSLLEAGVVQFDFYQQVEDLTRFTLVEIYLQPEDQLRHRESAHYLRWRDKVADLMAEPRIGIKYRKLAPFDQEI